LHLAEFALAVPIGTQSVTWQLGLSYVVAQSSDTTYDCSDVATFVFSLVKNQADILNLSTIGSNVDSLLGANLTVGVVILSANTTNAKLQIKLTANGQTLPPQVYLDALVAQIQNNPAILNSLTTNLNSTVQVVRNSFNATTQQQSLLGISANSGAASPPGSISGGAIFGIIFIILAAIGGIAFLIYHLVIKKQGYNRVGAEDNNNENEFYVLEDG